MRKSRILFTQSSEFFSTYFYLDITVIKAADNVEFINKETGPQGKMRNLLNRIKLWAKPTAKSRFPVV